MNCQRACLLLLLANLLHCAACRPMHERCTCCLQALIQWLEIERALICNNKKTRHSSILFPPALDLPSKLASPGDLSNLPKQVPDVFLCPISLGIMQAPAVTPSGMSYDRCAASHTRCAWQQLHVPVTCKMAWSVLATGPLRRPQMQGI